MVLRYIGNPDNWGFAAYLASRNGYEDSILPHGSFTGTPEAADLLRDDLAARQGLDGVSAPEGLPLGRAVSLCVGVGVPGAVEDACDPSGRSLDDHVA